MQRFFILKVKLSGKDVLENLKEHIAQKKFSQFTFCAMESIYDCFKLNNDMKIPCVGFGTYKAAEGNNVEVLKTAIEAGYRYFDTASFYQTEDFLGQAIRESNLPREDFFLVSKMWKDEMGYQQTKDALEKSLKRLGTDYLDI